MNTEHYEAQIIKLRSILTEIRELVDSVDVGDIDSIALCEIGALCDKGISDAPPADALRNKP